MAKVIIENTREHDITINVFTPDPAKEGKDSKTGTTTSLTIPGARQSKEDKKALSNGRAEADDAFIDAAIKGSPVVAHYFDEGWLVISRNSRQQHAEKK